MADGLNNFFESVGGTLGGAIGNPVKQRRPNVSSGNARAPFLDPGLTLGSSYNTSPSNSAPQSTSGFLPLSYVKTPSGYQIQPPIVGLTTKERTDLSKAQYFSGESGYLGDERSGSFKFSLDQFNLFSSDPESRVRLDEFLKNENDKVCYYDNEDPVYFGFEIIIDVENSPLLNGSLSEFLNEFGGSITEINERRKIYNQFKKELNRYFKFSTELENSTEVIQDGLIYQTCNNPRRYYVKKIDGLNLLIESNSGDTSKSFVDYPKEKLSIGFFEDTTLNLGTLAVLYKSLYWSKLRGKSIIPENLLRFDCQIIVSELRNIARLKRTGDVLEELRANLSRYVYKVYECQFFFKDMTHPPSVDMGQAPTATTDYLVPFAFKYSNLIFERWNPITDNWGTVRDDKIEVTEPRTPSTKEYSRNVSAGVGPAIEQYKYDTSNLGASVPTTTTTLNTTNLLQSLQQNSRIITPQIINPPLQNPSRGDLLGKASAQLLENLKNAALNEVQRGLNLRFRLINDSLDRIRDRFNIGRMPPPTNVYFPTQNTGAYGTSNFFFDVQRSLRNFAGDFLTGLITGS